MIQDMFTKHGTVTHKVTYTDTDTQSHTQTRHRQSHTHTQTRHSPRHVHKTWCSITHTQSHTQTDTQSNMSRVESTNAFDNEAPTLTMESASLPSMALLSSIALKQLQIQARSCSNLFSRRCIEPWRDLHTLRHVERDADGDGAAAAGTLRRRRGHGGVACIT